MSKTETMSQEPFHFQMYQAPKRTKRIDKLYEYVGASKVGMCLERGKIITDVYMKNQSVPPIILRCKFCSNGTPILKSAVHSF